MVLRRLPFQHALAEITPVVAFIHALQYHALYLVVGLDHARLVGHHLVMCDAIDEVQPTDQHGIQLERRLLHRLVLVERLHMDWGHKADHLVADLVLETHYDCPSDEHHDDGQRHARDGQSHHRRRQIFLRQRKNTVSYEFWARHL